MKATKITYWVTTGLASAFFLLTTVMYVTRNPKVLESLKTLGYPIYMLDILATAKILGILALLTPKFPKLKEWAYAGFVIDLVGAIWSHTASEGFAKSAGVLVPLVFIIVSYVTYTKLQKDPATAIVKK